MKTKTIETNSETLLVVELYPEIDVNSIFFKDGFMTYRDHIGWDGVLVSEGNWQLICRLPDITEKQSTTIVSPQSDFQYEYISATQSLHSLLSSEGILFENPYGKEEPIVDEPDPQSQYYGSQMDLSLEWNHWQNKVWDINRVYLFKKLK